MTKVQTTLTDVLRTVKELADENPAKVYTAPEHMKQADACFYVHQDVYGESPEPGCIVGAALHKLGVPLEALAELEGRTGDSVFERLATTGDADDDARSAMFLRHAQIAQDRGEPWAVAHGKALMESAYFLPATAAV